MRSPPYDKLMALRFSNGQATPLQYAAQRERWPYG